MEFFMVFCIKYGFLYIENTWACIFFSIRKRQTLTNFAQYIIIEGTRKMPERRPIIYDVRKVHNKLAMMHIKRRFWDAGDSYSGYTFGAGAGKGI